MKKSILVLVLSLLSIAVSTGFSQTTAFTYQGKLADNGAPANGQYDLSFELCSGPAGDINYGLITLTNVLVTNGLFTVSLDYGDIFTQSSLLWGPDQWLEIGVRTNGSTNAFAILTPRQPVSPTPNAIFARKAANAASLVNPGFIGTTNNQYLTFFVDNQPVMSYVPTTNTVNIIGGWSGNIISNNVEGGTIGGGGTSSPFNGESQPNIIGNDWGTIAGGYHNLVTGYGGFIGGGSVNRALNSFSMIGGGQFNTNAGNFGAIPGGKHNVISNSYASIGGGFSNLVTGSVGVIAGGLWNTNTGSYAVIGGGHSNTNGGTTATIGGGWANTVSRDYGTIGGGRWNVSTNEQSTVAGGAYNIAGGLSSVVGGGWFNRALSPDGAVLGGTENLVTGLRSAVVGGFQNQAMNDYGFLGGGHLNNINSNATYATIGGGYFNTIRSNSSSSVISGGYGNTIDTNAYNSVIAGGAHNTIQTNAYQSIIAGYGNSIQTNSYGSIIAGGQYQTIYPFADQSTISGGYLNKIYSPDSVIAGGTYNTISNIAWNGVISGGSANTISNNAYNSFVGGGVLNSIGVGSPSGTIVAGYGNMIGQSSSYSFLGGGYSNLVSAVSSVLGGGRYNTASATHSVVSGGFTNTATGPYSAIPGGTGARTLRYGQLAHAAGSFANQGDAQESTYILRNTTTDASTLDLYLDGSSQLLFMLSGTAMTFNIQVVARTSGGVISAWEIKGAIRNRFGTTLCPTAPTITPLASEIPGANVTCVAMDAGDYLSIRATGTATEVIRWVATVRTTEVVF